MAIKDHRMIVIRSLMAAFLAAGFSLFSAGAFAAKVEIDVVNFGFEDPLTDPLNDGEFRYEVPNGWTAYDPEGEYCPCPNSSRFNLGTINPNTTYSGAPEGANVGFIYIGVGDGAGFDPEYPLGLQQDLKLKSDSSKTVNLVENSRYNLTVMVGNAKTASEDFDGFGGYKIQLLAGGEVFAQDHNTLSWINEPEVPNEEGTFKEASLSFLTGTHVTNLDGTSSDNLIGMALGIRLIHTNEYAKKIGDQVVAGWASEIAFDDVQLTVSAVPVPAAVWLFGTALLGMIGFGKRRKSA